MLAKHNESGLENFHSKSLTTGYTSTGHSLLITGKELNETVKLQLK